MRLTAVPVPDLSNMLNPRLFAVIALLSVAVLPAAGAADEPLPAPHTQATTQNGAPDPKRMFTAVPEPSAWALFGVAAGGLLFTVFRRRAW